MQELIENKDELLKKIWTKCPRPSDAEYKKLLFDTEITLYEINLIHAYQINEALKNVNDYVAKMAKEDGNYDWIEFYKRDYYRQDMDDDMGHKITRIDYAFKHLNKVCEFARNYKNPYKYEYEWLVDYDKILADRLKMKFGFYKTKKTKQKDDEINELAKKYTGE